MWQVNGWVTLVCSPDQGGCEFHRDRGANLRSGAPRARLPDSPALTSPAPSEYSLIPEMPDLGTVDLLGDKCKGLFTNESLYLDLLPEDRRQGQGRPEAPGTSKAVFLPSHLHTVQPSTPSTTFDLGEEEKGNVKPSRR